MGLPGRHGARIPRQPGAPYGPQTHHCGTGERARQVSGGSLSACVRFVPTSLHFVVICAYYRSYIRWADNAIMVIVRDSLPHYHGLYSVQYLIVCQLITIILLYHWPDTCTNTHTHTHACTCNCIYTYMYLEMVSIYYFILFYLASPP